MAILDRNGNPVSSRTPEPDGIIRDPIDEVPSIHDDGLDAIVAQVNEGLRQGAAPTSPVQIHFGLLAALARTVRDQRAVLRALDKRRQQERAAEESRPEQKPALMPAIDE